MAIELPSICLSRLVCATGFLERKGAPPDRQWSNLVSRSAQAEVLSSMKRRSMWERVKSGPCMNMGIRCRGEHPPFPLECAETSSSLSTVFEPRAPNKRVCIIAGMISIRAIDCILFNVAFRPPSRSTSDAWLVLSSHR